MSTVKLSGLRLGGAGDFQISVPDDDAPRPALRWLSLPRCGDKWHLDEVVLSIAGKKHWLWRAVDQEGLVLDVLVQSRRDKKAAKRLFRKLLKKQGRAPRVLITEKLRSYTAARREIMPSVEPRQNFPQPRSAARRFQ